MYITMKEYFKAKQIEMDNLPIVNKTATGLHEHIIFKGGIVAKLMRGRFAGKRCVWMPDSAKYVNKVLTHKVFNGTAVTLSLQANNVNELLFENFGDVRVMWTIPKSNNIVKHLIDGLNSRYGHSCYVGYTTTITLTNLGNADHLNDKGTYPELTSVSNTSSDVRDELEDRLHYLETALDTEMVKSLNDNLESSFLGYDDKYIYFISKVNEVIRLGIRQIENVKTLMGKPSFTVGRIIDDYETSKL